MPKPFSMSEHPHLEVTTGTSVDIGNQTLNGTTVEIDADNVLINRSSVITRRDLDQNRFRYLGYEKYEYGMLTRHKKLQQRTLKINKYTGQKEEVWEDIPTVEE